MEFNYQICKVINGVFWVNCRAIQTLRTPVSMAIMLQMLRMYDEIAA